MSSATLASSAKWLNARMTGIAWWMSIPSNMRRHLGPIDLGASHPERFHPGALDEVEHLVTVLLAHGVAEDGAEQPDVRAHRLGRLATDPGPLDGTDRFQRGIGYAQPCVPVSVRIVRTRPPRGQSVSGI